MRLYKQPLKGVVNWKTITFKFCILTINLSEVWPRWILLQTTVFEVCLTNMLNISQRLVTKNSLTWWYVFKTSWRCLQDIFVRRLEDVLQTSWRRLKTSWRCLEDVLKASWKRLEDVLKTYGQDEYIGVDQDVLKINKND